MPDNPPQMFDSSLDIDQATSVIQVGESSSSVAVSSSSPTSASVAAGFDSLSVVSEKPEMFTSGTEKPSLADFKIPMSAAQTLELALSKQKEEKSQSADLLTERENQYIAELEKTAQKVENERISLIAQVTKLQRDRNALAAENSELKLLLQTRKEQANSKDRSPSS